MSALINKTNGYRRRFTEVEFTRRSRRPGPKALSPYSGMTLVELLVAMVILLVGVWTVASGFPRMMRAVTLEQQRTQAGRMAEGRLEALRMEQARLPEAVIASPSAVAMGVDPADIWPDSKPEDPDNPWSPANSPNARDDITRIIGERLRIPAAPVGDDYTLATVTQGLIERDNTQVAVWETHPLQRLPFPPTGPVPAGCFYMDSGGVISLPAGYDGVIVDYVWEDTNSVRHWVQGERVPAAAPFIAGPNQLYVRPRAAHEVSGAYPFGAVVPASARVEGLIRYPVVDADGSHPLSGEVAIEPSFGVGLVFNDRDAGREVLVDYLLAQDNTKRLLYLMEEQVVGGSACRPDPSDPTYCYATVQLGWDGLDPKFMDSAGQPVYVLAVDRDSNGRDVYYDGAGITPVDVTGARTGRIEMHLPVSSVGHHFRFYYGTVDQACVEVYKAPANYVDSVTASAYADPLEVNYRTYSAVANPSTGLTDLHFSMSNLGATVAVDYVWDDAGALRLVAGEMHTLALSAAGNDAVCTLQRPNVLEIRAVRGVSVKVRPWWRTPAGRLVYYDLDSILVPVGAL